MAPSTITPPCLAGRQALRGSRQIEGAARGFSGEGRRLFRFTRRSGLVAGRKRESRQADRYTSEKGHARPLQALCNTLSMPLQRRCMGLFGGFPTCQSCLSLLHQSLLPQPVIPAQAGIQTSRAVRRRLMRLGDRAVPLAAASHRDRRFRHAAAPGQDHHVEK